MLGFSTHGLQLLPAYLQALTDWTMASRGDPTVIADHGHAMDMGCELAAGRCRRKCRTGCGLCAHGPQCHGDYRSAKVEPYRMPCDSLTGCGAARIFSSANMLRSRSCERRAALSSARTHDPQSDFGGLADGKRADRHRRVPLHHYERHGQQLCQAASACPDNGRSIATALRQTIRTR